VTSTKILYVPMGNTWARRGERERERGGHWPGEGNGEGARMAGRFRLEEMVGGDWRAGVGDGERKIGNQ
jgi:hypothetical protein